MDRREADQKINQIKKNVHVTWEEPEDSRAGNGPNVVVALTDLDESDGNHFKGCLGKVKENIFLPTVELHYKSRSLLKLPATLAFGAGLLALKKPKLLFLSLATILASGADLTLEGSDRTYSLQEAAFTKSRKAAKCLQGLKDRFDGDGKVYQEDNRTKAHGDRYFEIQL